MAQRTLSSERFKQFLQESTKYFSWETILRDGGITRVSDKGDQFEIECPLHADRRPSCRLNKRTGLFHCFSCNAKGSYTRFMWHLAGEPVAYSVYCEQILKANPAMQRELKFTSLFIEGNTLDPAFATRRVFNKEVHLGSELPIATLVSQAKALDDSWDTLCYTLTMLQQEMSTDSVLTLLKKRVVGVTTPAERVGLMDLI